MLGLKIVNARRTASMIFALSCAELNDVCADEIVSGKSSPIKTASKSIMGAESSMDLPSVSTVTSNAVILACTESSDWLESSRPSDVAPRVSWITRRLDRRVCVTGWGRRHTWVQNDKEVQR